MLAAGALLAGAAALAYCRIFSVPVLFDGISAITDNASIRHLGSSLLPPADTTVSGRPVLNLSFALNYAISGTRIWSYQAANLSIHILSGLALFGIVRRTLAGRAVRDATLWAFLAALLWTVHPLLTESVTYTVQRAESLMGLFYLATLYCFIRGASSKSRGAGGWFVLSVASCFLGMGTKEVMVSAPLIILAYDRTFLAGSVAAALRLRWRTYGGLAASWILLGFLVLSTGGRSGTVGFDSGVSWMSYGVTQIIAVVHYLRLALWPAPLVFDYGVSLVPWGSKVLASGLFIVVLAAATAWAFIERPGVGFLGVCFFAVLAPSSSIIPVATETLAEHRMYLALAPVAILIVVGLRGVLGRASIPVIAVLAAALLGLTLDRNETYRSDEAVWADTVAKRPDNARAHNNLGYVLAQKPGRQDEAIAQYDQALVLAPHYAQAHFNLGMVLVAMPGRLNDAIAHFRQAVLFNPNLVDAHYNLGLALMSVPGQMGEAARQYGEALRLKPDYAEAHYNMGCALGMIPGRKDEAIAEYESALRLNPGLAEAHFNLGYELVTIPGRTNDAIEQFRATVRLKPGYVPALCNLALALNSIGKGNEARTEIDVALRLQPDNAVARGILARIGPDP